MPAPEDEESKREILLKLLQQQLLEQKDFSMKRIKHVWLLKLLLDHFALTPSNWGWCYWSGRLWFDSHSGETKNLNICIYNFPA